MKTKLILRILNSKKVIDNLEKYGTVVELSKLFGLYSIEIDEQNIENIHRMDGVLEIEYNDVGKLQYV